MLRWVLNVGINQSMWGAMRSLPLLGKTIRLSTLLLCYYSCECWWKWNFSQTLNDDDDDDNVMMWEVTKRQVCQEGDSSEGSSWSSRHLIIRFNDHDEDDAVDEDNNDDDHDHEGVKDSDCLGSKQLLIRRLIWKNMMILTLRIKRMEPLVDNNHHFWMRHKYKCLDSDACIGYWWRKLQHWWYLKKKNPLISNIKKAHNWIQLAKLQWLKKPVARGYSWPI